MNEEKVVKRWKLRVNVVVKKREKMDLKWREIVGRTCVGMGKDRSCISCIVVGYMKVLKN